MGSPESEWNHKASEQQHTVTLTKGFWLLETEVTQKMWLSVVGEYSVLITGKSDDLPITYVNASPDIEQFLNQLGQSLGIKLSLPTEAQWEYACRAGSNEHNTEIGTDQNRTNFGPATKPVKQFKPNDWGLYDMYGNVQEWCADFYAPYSADGIAQTDPTGPETGKSRVTRGKAVVGPKGRVHTDWARTSVNPVLRAGFRVVLLETPYNPLADPKTKESRQAAIKDCPIGKTPGERRVLEIKNVPFAFRWCPPGSYWMGSSVAQDATEHPVTLTKGFWIMETKFTYKMAMALAESKGIVAAESKAVAAIENRGIEEKSIPLLPTLASWTWANTLADKMTELLGERVQLPTEAQWEYACRAGTKGGAFPFAGNPQDYVWFSQNPQKDSREFNLTHPVETKKPNNWGLFDIIGNQREWCADVYKQDLGARLVIDPFVDRFEEAVKCDDRAARVVRGGTTTPSASHQADCGFSNPSSPAIGFRFVIVSGEREKRTGRLPYKTYFRENTKQTQGENSDKTTGGRILPKILILTSS